MLKRIFLDQRAFEYTRQQLSLGSSYAALLTDSLLEEGVCYAYLPEDVNINQIQDLAT